MSPFLNVEEAAALLRCSCSNLYSYSHLRKIPLFKVGKAILFLEEELVRWVRYGADKSAAERVIAEREAVQQ